MVQKKNMEHFKIVRQILICEFSLLFFHHYLKIIKKTENLFLALFLRIISSILFIIALDIYFLTIIIYSF